jgi:hypothetical protein
MNPSFTVGTLLADIDEVSIITPKQRVLIDIILSDCKAVVQPANINTVKLTRSIWNIFFIMIYSI